MLHPLFKIVPFVAIMPGLLLAAPVSQYESNVPVDHLYAPAGFNSFDNSEVVVSGYLPNLCYHSPKAYVEVIDNKISIGVKAIRNGGFSYCADVIVPFIQEVNLGPLDQGDYQIVVNEDSQWEKKEEMQIAEASSNSVNDVIYANVSEVANVENSHKVLLKGFNPSDCFVLDKIEVVDNGKDSYSIKPMLKQIREFCPKKMMPFSYEFNIPHRLQSDKILLHVRIMDGKSLNALYNYKPIAEE